MIQIKKHDKVISIPSGAFKMYASAGWELVKDSKSPAKKKAAKTEEAEPSSEVSEEADEVDEVEEVPDEDEADEYEEIEVDPEELLEKPLEELDFEELNIVAEYLGIDTSKLKTGKALRAAIKKSRE